MIFVHFLCGYIGFFRNFARQMEKLDAYKVDLNGMQDDAFNRSLTADDDFFAVVQGSEIQHGDVAVWVQVHRNSSDYELSLKFQGEVEVLCDRCLEPMRQPVEGEALIKVCLGDVFEDDGDKVVVPETSGILDFSWLLYEQIALQIPLSHVHSQGECDETMQSVMMQHEVQGGESSDEETRTTDPRWDALKKLISTNN